MKVKIMDYETAKAEVLAREQNPRLANDKRVWGVDKTWKGWGQVRDIYKDAIYSQDLEDGYAFPNYLIVDVTPEDALRYGELLSTKNLFFMAPFVFASSLIAALFIIIRW